MPTYKTEGIVLARFNLGEADRIVSFFTRDRGKLRAVAKGVRRIKSRMAGHLELFNTVELMLATGRNLDVITSARLRQHHQGLSDNYDKLSYGYLFAEMVEKLTGEDEPHVGVFELLEQSLSSLEAGAADALLELFFKLRLASELGYRPELSACVVCGKSDPASSYFFSFTKGGIVDATCRTAEASAIDQRQIKLWRLIFAHPLADVRRIEGANDLAKSGLQLCNNFYDELFGKRFKSLQTLK